MRVRLTAAVLVFLLAGVPAAIAQAPCSIQTITGTYAIQATSFSARGILDPGVGYKLTGGALALVGQATVSPIGAVSGSYWGVMVAAPLPEAPFTGTISVNSDCTAEYADANGTSKLVILEGGKQIQEMSWQAFGTSVSTWYRITRAADAAPRCGVQNLKGTYMQRCEGFHVDASMNVTTANLLVTFSAQNGSISGTFRENQFGFPNELIESTLTGTYTVYPDCKVEMNFAIASLPPGFTVRARGVLFDEGKQGVGVPLGMYVGNTMVAPMAPLACRLVRMGQ